MFLCHAGQNSRVFLLQGDCSFWIIVQYIVNLYYDKSFFIILCRCNSLIRKECFVFIACHAATLDLQPFSWDLQNNVARPRLLVPTITLIKYSFVSHHQHGWIASQEYIKIYSDITGDFRACQHLYLVLYLFMSSFLHLYVEIKQ